MKTIMDTLHAFFSSARTYVFLTTLLAGAVALRVLDAQQADALLKCAVEIGIAFFGGTWVHSVGQRDISKTGTGQ